MQTFCPLEARTLSNIDQRSIFNRFQLWRSRTERERPFISQGLEYPHKYCTSFSVLLKKMTEKAEVKLKPLGQLIETFLNSKELNKL